MKYKKTLDFLFYLPTTKLINVCLCTCSPHFPLHPKSKGLSHQAFQTMLFQEENEALGGQALLSIFKRQATLRNEREKKKNIEISQDLDTFNWDFMPYFPGDSHLHSSLQKVVFPRGLRWKKTCSSVIGLWMPGGFFSFFLNQSLFTLSENQEKINIFAQNLIYQPVFFLSFGCLMAISYFKKIRGNFTWGWGFYWIQLTISPLGFGRINS